MSLSNLTWSRACTEILYRIGVRHVCISPGSRNSSLTIGLTEHKHLNCFSIIDERSSAFFALGIAKSTQTPVAVLSTSGTAAANFYPAVIEANLSRTPLLVLTADRPPYLINTGANQTIDQHDLFGRHIRTCIDMGLPSSIENLYAQLRRGFLNAAGLSHNGHLVNPPGPVHLNFPFSEPLIDLDEYNNPVDLNSHNFDRLNIEPINKTPPDYTGFPEILDQTISETEKLLVICGEGLNREEQEGLVKLTELLNIPVLADSLSGLRFGLNSEVVCTNYDCYEENIPTPDLILRFGKKPNSKNLNQFMDKFKEKTLLFDPAGRFNDDAGQVHSYSVSDVWNLFSQKETVSNNNSEYFNQLKQLESNYKFPDKDPFSEERIVSYLFDCLPENSNIFIGNSLPIRHVDNCVQAMDKKINVFSNRGASGIDGINSTAMGMAVTDKNADNFLLIGDVSFFHDLTGMQAAKYYNINLTIVVLNNGGGQIFNRLPYSKYGIKSFDEFWITEPTLNIENAVNLFDGSYRKLISLEELQKYMLQKNSGLQVFECQTE